MKKSELLKMPKGVYLLTDSIYNYKYILHKTENEGHVAMIRDIMSQCAHVHFHYGLIQSFDDDFDRWIPYKRLECSANVGGLSVSQKSYFSVLNDLQLVGRYNKETISDDIKKFALNYKIGLNRYDRMSLRKNKR